MRPSSDSPPDRASHGDMHLGGVGPFITFRSYSLAGRWIIWQAREHRKGLLRTARAAEHLPLPLWQTRRYNQVMSATFALGSCFFMLGSLLCLLPQPSPALTAWANLIFFIGSLPFTLAAYMQHFQAANTTHFTTDPSQHLPLAPLRLLGWRPHNLGWLSTLTQLLGTFAFNISTWDAIPVASPWYRVDAVVWLPDMVGSVLFLVSAYLAFIEANHALWRWQPRNLTWRIVFVNWVGCIAFMGAACTAYMPAQGQAPWMAAFSNVQLLLGAACFLAGALLSLRESQAADLS